MIWSLLGTFTLPVTLRFFNLQHYFDKFCEWSSAWDLNWNPSKCKVITFTVFKKPVVSTYYIDHIALERVFDMRDLDVILNSKLNFGPHIDSIVGGGRIAHWICTYILAFSLVLSCAWEKEISAIAPDCPFQRSHSFCAGVWKCYLGKSCENTY